jgi:hypothetical protein
VAPRDDEDEDERLDRELIELLNEVRVAMPGVQVLFGFLLAVPFQQRFGDTSSFQRGVYLATVLAAAFATAFLVALPSYHRIMFRQRDKPALIAYGNKLAIAGLVMLAASMIGAVLLVTDLWFGVGTTGAVVGIVTFTYLGLWFAFPLSRRIGDARSRDASA